MDSFAHSPARSAAMLSTHVCRKISLFVPENKYISFYRNSSPKSLFSGINELTTLQQSVQQNCFFVHCENLLLSNLRDEGMTVSAKAVHIIQKIINAEEGIQEAERDPDRKFHLSMCNFCSNITH